MRGRRNNKRKGKKGRGEQERQKREKRRYEERREECGQLLLIPVKINSNEVSEFAVSAFELL